MKQKGGTCPTTIDIYVLMLIPTISLVAVAFAHFSVHPDVVRGAFFLMLAAGVAVCFVELKRFRKNFRPWQPLSLPKKLLLLYAVSIVGFTSIMALATPMFAWDALRHWGESGVSIAQSMSGSVEATSIWLHRHPPGLTATLGIHGLLFPDNGSLSSVAAIWILSLLAIATSIRLLVSLRGIWTLPVAAALISVPYIDNHVISWGYAGLPMTAALTAACIFLIYFERTSRPLYLYLSLLGLCSVALFKNIGVLYVILTVVSVLATKFVCGWRATESGDQVQDLKFRSRSILLAFVMVCVVLGGTLAINNYDGHLIQILGKRLVITLPNFEVVTNLLTHSVLKNASFNLLFMVTAIATASLSYCYRIQERRFELVFLLLLAFLAASLWLASLGTEYGLARAVPTRDTGGTRHLLTPAVLCTMYLSVFVSSINTAENNASQLRV